MAKGKRLVFRKDEISRVKSLISFNFDKFNLCAKDYLPEKLLLYKACRIFEQELIDALAIRPQNSDEELERSNTLQAIYLQLGHVNLLARDYARALSAYQKAYGYNKEDFWKDASGLYGLGLAYLHFRAFRPAIDAFCRLLFCHPYVDVATEVHARLGVAYKCLEEFSQSLKHLLIALDDAKELALIPRYELRFHIAHCYDGFRDFRRAVEEYRRLLADHERAQFRLPIPLLSAVFRQLGWISLRSRENESKEEIRVQKLKEAEQLLCKARDLTPTDSRTNCYLGLCYSEQTLPPPPPSSSTQHFPQQLLVSSSRGNSVAPQQQRPSSACANNTPNSSGRSFIAAAVSSSNSSTNNSTDTNGRVAPSDQRQLHQQLVAADRAQDAFVSYRSAIDSDESDANNWCSIGVLYQQQNQPIDALQAFACAVQLDERHSASWTELGRLYELHRQFHESLYCYRRALQHNPAVSESLKARVFVLEKEFSSAPGGHAGAAAAAQTHQQQLLKQQQGAAGTAAATPALNRLQVLPSLENAWHLGIPAQVRQRLGDFYKQQQNRYREGSPLWTMSELAAHAMRQPFYELDPTQRQIMRILKLNKERLEQNELRLLRQLEDHYNALVGNNNNNKVLNNNNSNKNVKEEATATIADGTADTEKDGGSALQPREELKLRISRTAGVVLRTAAGDENGASTATTDFPCISQDDLEDVLGGSIVAEQPESSNVREATGQSSRPFLDTDRKSHKYSPKRLLASDEKKRKRRKKRQRGEEDNDYAGDDRRQHSPGGCSVASSASSSTPGEQRSRVSSSMGLRNSDIFDAELDDDVEEEESAGISAVQLHAERVVCTSPSASSPSTSNGELLPPAFSMLARVHVPVTVSSAEILEMCKKRRSTPHDYRPIFDEHCPPPQPPVRPPRRPTREGLLLRVPWIIVDSARDAATSELQNFCYNAPIALVHGLTAALKIDLSQFSTKSLIQTAPDHEVEVRTQYKMPGDVNLDGLGNPTWACHSTKSFTTIGRYGQYQAESFRHSLKEETEKLKLAGSSAISSTATRQPNNENDVPTSENGAPSAKRRRAPGGASSTPGAFDADSSSVGGGGAHHFKTIKFGTNVDLSDERKFHAQLHELNKMPAFCRISAACNLLTHLGYTVLGMNTVQLYMKVPGCRTPGHLENNSFASVNINIGPGECEWFGVPYEYWPVIERMCKQRGIDFLKGAWWPSFQDLIDAEVPCYRFTQKAGDMVWVGGGCVHWVQATGWCNNVAWNVGPITVNQLEMALMAHEWNRLNTYRSLVPMQHLAWQLARSVRFSNQQVFNVVKQILIRSLAYCRMVADYVEHSAKSAIKPQLRQKGEAAHYCHLCEIEVFNILFVKEVAGKFRVFCVQCARKNHIDDYVVLQEIPFDELTAVFDRLQLHPSKSVLVC